MIAYEELCDALARWRTKNGLANGPAAATRATRAPAPAAAAFAPAVTAQNEPAYEDRTSTSTQAAPAEATAPKLVRRGCGRGGALASHVIARRRGRCALAGPLGGALPGPVAAALAREAPLAYALLARAGTSPGDVTVWIGDGALSRYGVSLAR